MSALEIDLSKFISDKDTALVGRDYGKTVLGKITSQMGDFTSLESQYETINIRVPKRIVTINKSFFLGFFELRVLALGKEKFLTKYKFAASAYIENKISSYADSALLSASMKDILDV